MLAGNGAGLRRYIATVRIPRDHFLPPDPTAFLAAEPDGHTDPRLRSGGFRSDRREGERQGEE